MDERRATLEALFEGAPRFVARLDALETESLDVLLERAEEVALAMPEDEQIELIDAHPRIGAAPETLSTHSFREQGYQGDQGSAELATRLARLNDEYETRFGFRFVIFVDGRSRAEIAGFMAASLDAPRAAERRRALRDVIAIASSRYARQRQEQPA
jgi:2-oxo-4-hydroxy-4-carboxy--5-ureidoimidazoline (OHCU) decarboxylase